MKSWKALLFLDSALALCLVSLGCGGSSTPGPTQLSISSGASLPTGRTNTAYSATLSASGGTAPYAWTVASGSLPGGLSLSSSGLISGMPSAAGTATFTAQVADAEATPQKATEQLSITIVTPLTVATTSLLNGILNASYASTVTATGGTAPYTWSVTSGALPPGLNLSTSGAITGTPTSTGVSTFMLQVADAETAPQKATAQFSITVVPPLSITTTSLPGATLDVPYSASLTATGGATPYSWSLTSGALPLGLSLSATGAISGTPTGNGNFSFIVQVADAESTPQVVTAQLSLTVSSPFSITTTTVFNGTVNTPYTANLTAIGGVTPYSWSLASGSLPTGLSLSSAGAITGTPSVQGVFDFTVQADDAESPPKQATRQLSITITAHLQVTTQHYDNFRTGQDLDETVLNLANVNVNQFGKLFSVAVDGQVYAQPLYMPDITIPANGVHNVIYVATEHDSVFALDADSNTGGNSTPLWQTSFIDPANGINTISSQDVNCGAISPEIGITSTPVIDPATNTIYVLAETKEHGQFFHRLHALDITTGAEKLGGPVTIQATYPGTGDGSSGGILTFDPVQHLNRPGLLLSNGSIFIAWSSNCDNDPFHGWVMSYDKTTLQQKGVWVTTPNGGRGGIWMSGAGVAADLSGSIFLSTGNGTFDTSGSPTDFGDSIVRMTLAGSGLELNDYFTPYNQGSLDDEDEDVASGGVLLLPDQPGAHVHELIQSGKEGSIYVVDRDLMGGFQNGSNSQIVQNITNQINGIFAVPAYWNNNVYFGGISDNVKAFSLSQGLLSATPTSSSPTSMGYPGATPVVSAKGTANGIVWTLQTASGLNGGNEVLHAYDATNLGNELYNTAQNESRDNPGAVVRFAVPTIVSGKAYVGAANQVSVYGLLQQH